MRKGDSPKAVLGFLFILAGSFLLPGFALSQQDEKEIPIDVRHLNHREVYTQSEFLIRAPPETVWRVLLNELNQVSEFVPRYLFSRVVSPETADAISSSSLKEFDAVRKLAGDETIRLQESELRSSRHEIFFYVLQQIHFPWPISKRWALCRIVDRFDPQRNTFTRNYTRVAGNVIQAEGGWVVRPAGNRPGWSLVSYRNAMDAGIQIPDFLLKPVSRKIVAEMLKAFQKRAEELDR